MVGSLGMVSFSPSQNKDPLFANFKKHAKRLKIVRYFQILLYLVYFSRNAGLAYLNK